MGNAKTRSSASIIIIDMNLFRNNIENDT